MFEIFLLDPEPRSQIQRLVDLILSRKSRCINPPPESDAQIEFPSGMRSNPCIKRLSEKESAEITSLDIPVSKFILRRVQSYEDEYSYMNAREVRDQSRLKHATESDGERTFDELTGSSLRTEVVACSCAFHVQNLPRVSSSPSSEPRILVAALSSSVPK